MAKMNQRIRELLERRKVFALATATKNGIPNVVPIGALKVLDDETILISDQYFRKTLRNMKNNPQAAIAVYDIFEKRSV